MYEDIAKAVGAHLMKFDNYLHGEIYTRIDQIIDPNNSRQARRRSTLLRASRIAS